VIRGDDENVALGDARVRKTMSALPKMEKSLLSGKDVIG